MKKKEVKSATFLLCRLAHHYERKREIVTWLTKTGFLGGFVDKKRQVIAEGDPQLSSDCLILTARAGRLSCLCLNTSYSLSCSAACSRPCECVVVRMAASLFNTFLGRWLSLPSSGWRGWNTRCSHHNNLYCLNQGNSTCRMQPS